MSNWNFGVFADPAQTTPCFAAFVQATTLRDAINLLRTELKLVPMQLYVGPLSGKLLSDPILDYDDVQHTNNPAIVLVKLGS